MGAVISALHVDMVNISCRMRKKGDFSDSECGLFFVPDVLDRQPAFVAFIESEKEKTSMSSSSLAENTLLMWPEENGQSATDGLQLLKNAPVT